jgi:hypothetical protein
MAASGQIGMAANTGRRYLLSSGTDGIACVRVGRSIRVPRRQLEVRFHLGLPGGDEAAKPVEPSRPMVGWRW